MEKYHFDFDSGEDRDLSEREERCQKAIKAVTKAIAMRILICGLLLWIVLQSGVDFWVLAMLLLVMVMNLAGILPLASELKKRRLEWKALLKEEE